MIQKYIDLKTEYQSLEQQLQDPAVLGDSTKLQEVSQAYSDLKKSVEHITELETIETQITETKTMIEESEGDMKQMAREELVSLESKKDVLEEAIKKLIRPTDPMDKKNVIVEIRAGAGGDEASLFAGDLLRMYSRYAEQKKWKIEILDEAEMNKADTKKSSLR